MTTLILQPSPVVALVFAAIIIKVLAPLPRRKALIAVCTGLLIVSGFLVILDIANISARRSVYGNSVPWFFAGQVDAGHELEGPCGNKFVEVSINLRYCWVNDVWTAPDWIEIFFRDSHVPDLIYSYTNVTDSFDTLVLNFTPPYSYNNPLLLAAWEVVASNVNSSVPKSVEIIVFNQHSVPLIHTLEYSYVLFVLVFLSTSIFGLLVKKKKLQTTDVQNKKS